MLGWEFDPIKSGGLGVACRGISYGLADDGVKVLFAMPSYLKQSSLQLQNNVELLFYDGVTPIKVPTNFQEIDSPYASPSQQVHFSGDFEQLEKHSSSGKKQNQIYSKNFFQEIERFTEEAYQIAEKQSFDLIHAHDWMTFAAGKKIRRKLNKPLIAHVHATEIDRTGGHPYEFIKNREQEGLIEADHIIVVSNYTKQILEKYYQIPGDKISVVHNAAVMNEREQKPLTRPNTPQESKFHDQDKIILFLGRVTVQKGPEFFVDVAKKVLSKRQDVKFVIAGQGDMMPEIINKIIDYGISDRVLCSGFLQGEDISRAFYHADLYLMPSVSEPFGISALEAVQYGTPVLMSKTSGALEVIKNALFADFWDVDKIANQVMAILEYPVLGYQMAHEARRETKYLTWQNQAKKIKDIYEKVTPHL